RPSFGVAELARDLRNRVLDALCMLGYEAEDEMEEDHADTLNAHGSNVRTEQPAGLLSEEVRVRRPGRKKGS
ncbi:uncharacterized protein LY79DRAFT_492644, partial [Colletotrichum navitas]